MFKLKNILLILTAACLICGCATTKKLKAGKDSELVITEGMAPIVNNNLAGAKKVSLDEALKGALGLVVGIYVSQESLVSKAVLIEDNIVSQTEGYIEGYDILKESYDDKFYKTKIKAVVKKADLLAKMKALEINKDDAFKPIIFVSIKESVDNKAADTKYAENELKKFFTDKGYKVHLKEYADIAISGTVAANYDKDFSGIQSYQANLSLTAANLYGQEISNEQTTVGGAGITKEAASKASFQNAITKVKEKLESDIDKYTKDKAIAYLYVTGVPSANDMNGLVNTLRTMIEIKDCMVRRYDAEGSLIELYLKYPDFAKLVERLKNVEKLKITQFDNKNVSAEFVKDK